PRRMALVALARMARTARAASGKDPDFAHEAVQAMADAVFVENTDASAAGAALSLSRTAVATLASLASPPVASNNSRGAHPAHARDNDAAAVSVLDAAPADAWRSSRALDVDALLDGLAPHDASDADRGAALVRFAEPIRRAALAALRASGPRATAVIDALGSGQGELLPFVGPGQTGAAADAARALAAGLEPSVVPLARNPDPSIRTKAIVLVARSSDDAATDAIVAALEDPNEAVQRVAIAAVGAPRTTGRPAADVRAIAAVAKMLASHDSWAMRILAAQAFGRLGAIDALDRAVAHEIGSRLADAAARDSYALVRQASLEALAPRSEEHTAELQSLTKLVCRLL